METWTHIHNKCLTILSLFVASCFLSCTKINCDFYFNENGGTTTVEMDIEGNTLKVSSDGILSDNPSHFNVGTEDECYVVEQTGILVSFHPNERYIYMSGQIRTLVVDIESILYPAQKKGKNSLSSYFNND